MEILLMINEKEINEKIVRTIDVRCYFSVMEKSKSFKIRAILPKNLGKIDSVEYNQGKREFILCITIPTKDVI